MSSEFPAQMKVSPPFLEKVNWRSPRKDDDDDDFLDYDEHD